MGPVYGRERQGNHRDASRRRSVKHRTPDVDQIHEELKTCKARELDDDLPGGGRFYCVSCARHFITAQVLAQHEATKPHKRRLKQCLDDPWTQAMSERAAEMGC
eukprot:GHVS01043690.1.p1 GENE.GHVS01043690.1~~GHVS01043690.1.p1  ORF type:complete len:104 (+),score=9.87 GHVS01043690.1:3-314(+)